MIDRQQKQIETLLDQRKKEKESENEKDTTSESEPQRRKAIIRRPMVAGKKIKSKWRVK